MGWVFLYLIHVIVSVIGRTTSRVRAIKDILNPSPDDVTKMARRLACLLIGCNPVRLVNLLVCLSLALLGISREHMISICKYKVFVVDCWKRRDGERFTSCLGLSVRAQLTHAFPDTNHVFYLF